MYCIIEYEEGTLASHDRYKMAEKVTKIDIPHQFHLASHDLASVWLEK